VKQFVKLKTDFHVVLRLRMSGAVPLLPIYALMAWTETPLPFMIGCTVGEE
jgi:hypothetical protein